MEDKLSLIDVSNLNKKNKEKFLSVKRNIKRLKTREYRMLVRPYNALFLILESSLIFILNVFYFKAIYPTYMSQQKVLFFVFKVKLFFFMLIVYFIIFGIIFLLYKVKTDME